MQIWNGLSPDRQNFQYGGAVTIGNFDGLHLGHQSLLQRLARVGQPRVVITFDPHPLQILHPERHLRRIFPREDLTERLPFFGVDLLVILNFDRTFARTPARQFLQDYVYQPFQPKHVVAGYDFAFGSERGGTLDTLREFAREKSIGVDVMPPLRVGAEVVSSRRIRDLIIKGDVHGASLLLGREFYLRGEVVNGAGRGAQIGVPTLNQRVVNETLPLNGVYVSRTRIQDRFHPSVTNIGINPTFGGDEVKVETHLLDGTTEARGQVVDVHFFERLREERKFSDVEALKRQIQSDIQKAKAILDKVK